MTLNEAQFSEGKRPRRCPTCGSTRRTRETASSLAHGKETVYVRCDCDRIMHTYERRKRD